MHMHMNKYLYDKEIRIMVVLLFLDDDITDRIGESYLISF